MMSCIVGIWYFVVILVIFLICIMVSFFVKDEKKGQVVIIAIMLITIGWSVYVTGSKRYDIHLRKEIPYSYYEELKKLIIENKKYQDFTQVLILIKKAMNDNKITFKEYAEIEDKINKFFKTWKEEQIKKELRELLYVLSYNSLKNRLEEYSYRREIKELKQADKTKQVEIKVNGNAFISFSQGDKRDAQTK